MKVQKTCFIFSHRHKGMFPPLLLTLTSAKCSFCSETINANQCWGAQAG